jgi:hypothetical protein
MNVGDPKKAILLGVVALVAVGGAVFRLIPRNQAVAPAQSGAGQPQTEAQTQESPRQLITNPFSHPLLAQREGGERSNAQLPTGSATPPPAGQPVSSTLLPPLQFVAQGEPQGDQQSEVAPEPVVTVRLQAILSATERIALLEVEGTVHRVAAGQTILDGIRVKTIANDSITIQTPEGEKKLVVGATWEWKKK